MSEQLSLEAALNRFEQAMQTFEGAAVRVRKQLEANAAASSEAHAVHEDRSKLAAELDRTKAQLSDQNRVTAEAVKRLDAAMAAVAQIVEKESA